MGYVRNMLQLQYDYYLYIQAYLNSKDFGNFALTLPSQPIYPNHTVKRLKPLFSEVIDVLFHYS